MKLKLLIANPRYRRACANLSVPMLILGAYVTPVYFLGHEDLSTTEREIISQSAAPQINQHVVDNRLAKKQVVKSSARYSDDNHFWHDLFMEFDDLIDVTPDEVRFDPQAGAYIEHFGVKKGFDFSNNPTLAAKEIVKSAKLYLSEFGENVNDEVLDPMMSDVNEFGAYAADVMKDAPSKLESGIKHMNVDSKDTLRAIILTYLGL